MVNLLGKIYISKTGSEISIVPQEINNCSRYKKLVNFLPIKRDSAKAVLEKILASIQGRDHSHVLYNILENNFLKSGDLSNTFYKDYRVPIQISLKQKEYQ